MIKDVRWKFVAVVAILAMAVSLLSGGLGGIQFGVLIFRAVGGGIVFAILAIALNLLMARFFPEILESDEAFFGGESGESEEGNESPGSRVDIVMPSEMPGSPLSDNENPASGSDEGEAEGSFESGDEESRESDAPPSESSGEEAMGDLDRFSSDFSEVDDEAGVSSSKKADGPMADHDPEEIAQAIHTVLKRDEKG